MTYEIWKKSLTDGKNRWVCIIDGFENEKQAEEYCKIRWDDDDREQNEFSIEETEN